MSLKVFMPCFFIEDGKVYFLSSSSKTETKKVDVDTFEIL